MKRFARLAAALRVTVGTTAKVGVLARYLGDVGSADAAWAVHILGRGRRAWTVAPRRPTRETTTEVAQLRLAHGAEYDGDATVVADGNGDARARERDIARTSRGASAPPLHRWMAERARPGERTHDSPRAMVAACPGLDDAERAVWEEIVAGTMRVGVSRRIVVRAVAAMSGMEERVLSRRLGSGWLPSAEGWSRLVDPDSSDVERSEPYPFCLAAELTAAPESLGEVADWLVEWKWEGVRAQLVRRDGRSHIWSRDGELLTARFPELVRAAAALPDGTVLDGQLIAWRDGQPLGLTQLQRRMSGAKVTPRMAATIPVVLVPYDLLEVDGADVRGHPLEWRRARLALLLDVVRTPASVAHMRLSPELDAADWAAVHASYTASRGRGTAGLILKRRSGRYTAGERSGNWWKWKVRSNSVNAVLVRAHAGHGRRAAVHADYTLALWDDGWLVPVARVGAGLTASERRRLRAWIRSRATDDVGPSRAVPHELVFEVAFEAVESSARHECGLAVRSPRIVRWRTDMECADADTLATLRQFATGVPPA